MAIAARHGLTVVEDNAHGLFGRYKGRPLGSLGALATLSFHETKNVTCGEGGALVHQRRALHRARRDHAREGHQPQPVLSRRGRSLHLGGRRSSYLPSDLLAAYLLAQLEARDDDPGRRHAIWRRYAHELARGRATADVRLPDRARRTASIQRTSSIC